MLSSLSLHTIISIITFPCVIFATGIKKRQCPKNSWIYASKYIYIYIKMIVTFPFCSFAIEKLSSSDRLSKSNFFYVFGFIFAFCNTRVTCSTSIGCSIFFFVYFGYSISTENSNLSFSIFIF